MQYVCFQPYTVGEDIGIWGWVWQTIGRLPASPLHCLPLPPDHHPTPILLATGLKNQHIIISRTSSLGTRGLPSFILGTWVMAPEYWCVLGEFPSLWCIVVKALVHSNQVPISLTSIGLLMKVEWEYRAPPIHATLILITTVFTGRIVKTVWGS